MDSKLGLFLEDDEYNTLVKLLQEHMFHGGNLVDSEICARIHDKLRNARRYI